MSEVENLRTIETLDRSPFKHMVATIGNLPTSFVDSMSYYECIAWLVKYLETEVIPTVNNNAGAVAELQAAYIQLKEFVDNYFDNLDVQEEINNKLDQMAESGVLEEIIADYIGSNTKVIFPIYRKDGTDTLGDCTIIQTTTKSLMIDCFGNDVDTFSGITEALFENDISTLDYFIITHYDSDHYGNYQRLISAGYLNGATVILPKDVNNDYIQKSGAAIRTALENAGITWVYAEDMQTFDMDFTTINIYNGSDDDYAYYDSLGDISYNNYSLCVEAIYNNRKILIPGDCEYQAIEYITPKYLHANYDLIKDNHHSMCAYSSLYANTVNPKYVVCPTSVGMILKNINRDGSLLMAWSRMTQNIYVTGVQRKTLVANVNYNGVSLNKEAIANDDFGTIAAIDYYVDSTTDELQRDGSQTYPFKSLGEASALMTKHSLANVRLHIINIDNDTNQVRFSNFNRLTIDFGNKNINKIVLFSNINMLDLSNINMTNQYLMIENCRATITNFTSSSSINEQLIINHSDVEIKGTITSTNAIQDLVFAQRSNLYLSYTALDFTQTGTARIYKIYECNISMNDNTEEVTSVYNPTDVLTYYTELRYFAQYEKILTLFAHDDESASATIDLRSLSTSFNGLKVRLKNNDGYYQTIEMPKNILHCLCSFPLPNAAKDTVYWNMGIVNIINSNQMNITRSAQINVSTGGTTTSTGDKITIMQVIGIPQ